MNRAGQPHGPWIPSVEIAEPQPINIDPQVVVDDQQLLALGFQEHKTVVDIGLVLDEAPKQRAGEERRIPSQQRLEQLRHSAAVTPVLMGRLNRQGLVVGHRQPGRQGKRVGVAAAGGADRVEAQVDEERQVGGAVERQGLLQHRRVLGLVLADADAAAIGPGQADAMGVAAHGTVERRFKGGGRQTAVAVGSNDQADGVLLGIARCGQKMPRT